MFHSFTLFCSEYIFRSVFLNKLSLIVFFDVAHSLSWKIICLFCEEIGKTIGEHTSASLLYTCNINSKFSYTYQNNSSNTVNVRCLRLLDSFIKLNEPVYCRLCVSIYFYMHTAMLYDSIITLHGPINEYALRINS